MTILIIYILSFLYSSDTIRQPENLPIKNHQLHKPLLQKEQPQFLNDEYWDDDRLIFSTYFGGSGIDCINDAAIDSEGNIIQVGYTGSPDLPMIGNSFQNEKNLDLDMFIVKWNPDGDVIWSTFLGGSGADVLYSIALDKNDDIIIAGRTESYDIKVSEDAFQKNYQGESDFYLAKFTSHGDYLWSTFLGGSLQEFYPIIVLDENDYIYLGGTTGSTDRIPNKNNILLPTNDDSYMLTVEKVNNDGEYVTTYISKHTPDGKYIWGTYFGNRGNVTEVLTGLDVYKDEVAFCWDLDGYRLGSSSNHIFAIVTEDAEQKEGIPDQGWQTQVFKIDTSGTTLKYGTFYSDNQSVSRGVKYDSKGNLYLFAGIGKRKTPRKDSLFTFQEKDGSMTLVKYNRENKLAWDFGFKCENDGGAFYSFDIDKNDVFWTVGTTSCNEINQSENPFPSLNGPGPRPSSYLFILDLSTYNHWFSYTDFGISNAFSINVKNKQLYVSGRSTGLNVKNAFQSISKDNQVFSGAYYKIDMSKLYLSYTEKENKDLIIYPNPTTNTIQINNINEIQNLQITDLQGKKYIEINKPQNNEIDLSTLSIGIYYLTINHKQTFKIIKN